MCKVTIILENIDKSDVPNEINIQTLEENATYKFINQFVYN